MRNINNKRFLVQRNFINSLIISATICLLSLVGGYSRVTLAEEPANINANCATVNEQISIDIPCAEFSSTRFRLALDFYANPVDPKGLYFRLSDLSEIVEYTSSCTFIDNKLNLNINCASFDGSQYTFFLESYTNPFDNESFYWKVVDGDLDVLLIDGQKSNIQTRASSTATMISPSNYSTFSSTTQKFSWKNVGASQYYLYIGTAYGKNDILNFNAKTYTSVNVSKLPSDGKKLYVTLWTRHGNNWYKQYYTYTAYNIRIKKRSIPHYTCDLNYWCNVYYTCEYTSDTSYDVCE